MKLLQRKNDKQKKAPAPIERNNILDQNASFAIKEAYNTLRTNITFSVPENQCKIIGVTSSLASEGKSINCLNLAISFAETKAKVLLIDCDLRMPNIARLLNLKSTPGISNVLVNLSSLEDAVKHTKLSGLDVILSGDIPPNATELLSSNKMAAIISQLSNNYDYIFIDTPPVNLVTDATILSKYMTGIVFVVKQGESEKGEVIDAVNQLKFAEAKILGFILNGVSEEKRRYYKKGYYQYG